MTTPDALALADDAEEQAKSCVHAAQFPAEFPSRLYIAAGCLTGTASALRDLAGAKERAEKAEARVKELEANLVFWKAEAEAMRRLRDEERQCRADMQAHHEKRQHEKDKAHRAEIADMRAMVRGYRAALGEGDK